MKRILLLGLPISFALVTGLVFVTLVSADSPAPGGPFSTAFRVQNIDLSTATCTYVFYNGSGVSVFTGSPATIAIGDSMYVYTGDSATFGSLPSGMYSGVVSCDKQVAAVVNFSDPDSGASHSGITTPSLTWYAPGIYDNFYSYYSTLIVQNTTASAITITVDIYASGAAVPTKTQTQTNVPANASVSFEQEGLAELLDNVAYSAKITGTGNIAPIADIYGRGGANNQLYSYNPFSAGSTKAYAPIIMNNYYGNNTSLIVQNIGSATTTITVTYGTGQIYTQSLASNSAASLYTPSSGVPSGSLTSATVSSSTQPIVVVINESNPYNRAASYEGFPPTSSTKVRAPIVMRRYYNYNTSTVCQNISTTSTATTMTIQYTGSGASGSTFTSPSVAAGATYQFYQPADSLIPDGFIGAATITATQPIVCVVNEDQNEGAAGTTIWDQQYAYDGINN